MDRVNTNYTPSTASDEQQSWHKNAKRLSDFAFENMVNRTDCHGRYRSLNDRNKGSAQTIRRAVTKELLQQHFRATDRGDLIGLHTTSPDNTSRWLAIDIDLHGEEDSEVELKNEKAALEIYEMFVDFETKPLLLKSNGHGGFHVLILFDSPVASELVHRFGNSLVDEWQDLGLCKRPEVFPKQPMLQDGQVGNWVRLLGLHHTFDFYSQVWDGKAWLSGDQAIDHVCNAEKFSGEGIATVGWDIEKIDEHPEPIAECDVNPTNPTDLVLSRLNGVRSSGSGWVSLCPYHSDSEPSLSINEGNDGRVLMHCHAGCELDDILEAIDLESKDLFAIAGSSDEQHLRQLHPAVFAKTEPQLDLASLHQSALKATTASQLEELASCLSVSAESLVDLQVAWSAADNCWFFPERDDKRRIIGLLRRFPDGTKRFVSGGRRGLYIPKSFSADKTEIIIVEGGSDTAAGLALGWNVIGRPSAGGGAQELIALLKSAKSPIYVLGDNDPKRDGAWPGRKGAVDVSRRLQAETQAPVHVASIEMQFKDLRALVEAEGVSQ